MCEGYGRKERVRVVSGRDGKGDISGVSGEA